MQQKFINENGVEVTAEIKRTPDGNLAMSLETPTTTTEWRITPRELRVIYNLMHVTTGNHNRIEPNYWKWQVPA